MLRHGNWMMAAVLAGVFGMVALGQYRVPEPPVKPSPPTGPGGGLSPGYSQPENLGILELRIGLQKAQIQASLAEKVAQIKEESMKNAQANVGSGVTPVEDSLLAQVDALGARTSADVAKAELTVMEIQVQAGPLALQQVQAAAQQPPGLVVPTNPLLLQLMEQELKKVQIQSASSAKMVGLRQQLYDRLVAKSKAGGAGVNGGQTTDALVDLEGAKAAQQMAALDEQWMMARYSAAGGKR